MVYPFDHRHTKEGQALNALLGGKGAGLAAMTQDLDLPVPPGFTIPSTWCASVLDRGGLSLAQTEEIMVGLERVGASLGRRYGDPQAPLLVSVRSGAAVSMPGMMDTVLNVGLTGETVIGLTGLTNDWRFARQCYWRFLTMFVRIVMGADPKTDPDPPADSAALDREIMALRARIGAAYGEAAVDDARTLLVLCIEAVFRSWNSSRVDTYRRREGLDTSGGTAVTVQAMVFGNLDERSGSGVLFSRDPSTGENVPCGDFIIKAQGEEVVSGTHKTLDLDVLAERFPDIWTQLKQTGRTLERHYADMVDVEFTIESGRLWILQSRVGKRSTAAAARIAVEQAEDPNFPLSREQALARLAPDVIHTQGADEVITQQKPLATGVPASPGIATGQAVFDPDRALDLADQGADVILVRRETSPADVHGMGASRGILTSLGGQLSHAAIVARSWGIPAVCGAEALVIGEDHFSVGPLVCREGDVITIDGSAGTVMAGAVETRTVLDPYIQTIRQWAGLDRDPADQAPQLSANGKAKKMGRLQDKVAVITGATGGIGTRTAEVFLEEGAKVMLVGRTAAKLEAVRDSLDASGRVAICAADVGREEDVGRFVADTLNAFGRIDVAVVNAGTEGSIKPFFDLSSEDFDAVYSTNIKGSWLTFKHVAGAMLQSGGGSIVATGSVASLVTVPGLSAYVASKHALAGLVKSAAVELAETGVRVNLIAPCPVDNDMMRSIEKQAAPDQPSAARGQFEQLIPMKRYATNDEVARVALFLASDEASFCTGSIYNVDGGFCAV